LAEKSNVAFKPVIQFSCLCPCQKQGFYLPSKVKEHRAKVGGISIEIVFILFFVLFGMFNYAKAVLVLLLFAL
jgi:hypothetical protein